MDEINKITKRLNEKLSKYNIIVELSPFRF